MRCPIATRSGRQYLAPASFPARRALCILGPKTHTDQAMRALIKETEKMFTILQSQDLRDAGLIASAQKLEHYEIAAYGTAAALAGQLDLRDEQRTLHNSMEEEKEMDIQLTQLAKGEVNQDALVA